MVRNSRTASSKPEDDGGFPDAGHPIVVRLLEEVQQLPAYRMKLLEALEKEVNGRCLLGYFTSFNHPSMIEAADADTIEGILQKSDLRGGLSIIINSPGGDGLSAERIINVCRSYAHDNFEVIVPKMAKSAATMIAMGARKIFMSKTSELGPIDPQVVRGGRLVSAHSIIKSYQKLLNDAVECQGKIEPYLQQLARYDATEVSNLETAQTLAEGIAVLALSSGMMKGDNDKTIKQRIKPFTDPRFTSSHGRMINLEQARKCKLEVGEILLDGRLWEYYVRASWHTNVQSSKLIETKSHSFHTPRQGVPQA